MTMLTLSDLQRVLVSGIDAYKVCSGDCADAYKECDGERYSLQRV